mgnify:CR=1 FL=1
MTLTEFEQQVFATAMSSSLCHVPFVRRLTVTSISLRVGLATGDFIDAFHNEQTGTTAFALIRRGRRVFGADSTGGWHIHPFSDPAQHVPLEKRMSFADFVALVEAESGGVISRF